MTSSSKRNSPGGYSSLLRTGFAAMTGVVRDTHHAVADQTFALLSQAPVVSGPARLVEQAHSKISSGVYAAVNLIGGGVLAAAEQVERQWFADATERLPIGLRSPLNAAFGDHLQASDNGLAIPMALYFQGEALTLTPQALSARFTPGQDKICVLIHGLGCSDLSFAAEPPAVDLGAEMVREFATVSLYLRYNTGLSIAENGRQLSGLLEALLHSWPHASPELLLLGHSMGGLLARSACAEAAPDARWPAQVKMLISLGSPHLGAPLARQGEALQRALDFFALSAPIGRIGSARSLGVKELRAGIAATQASKWPQIEMRFLGAHLGDEPAHPLARWLGDGLVPIASATTLDGQTPTRSALLSEVGHLGLMNDPRAWAQVRDWVRELGGTWQTPARQRRARK